MQSGSPLRLTSSPGFGEWLGTLGGSLVVSTLTSQLLLFLSADPAGRITVGARDFGFVRGLSADGARIWVAANTRLFHLVNIGPRMVGTVAHDAVFPTQRAHFLGGGLLHDVVHDVRLGGERHEVVTVNTSFSVLATVDRDHSFRPLWKPKHISRLVPEDRCHLNCVGVRDGEIACVSLFGLTDAEGWRGARRDGGALIDVASQEAICTGLAKPHSPRWHRGRWWVLASDTGSFGYVDAAAGRLVTVARPGQFLRGLCMLGDYALIGATPRRGQQGAQPPVRGLVAQSETPTGSALLVVDLRSGAVVHALSMSGITGIYDIAVLPGVTRPLVPKFSGSDDDLWTSLPAEWAGETEACARAA